MLHDFNYMTFRKRPPTKKGDSKKNINNWLPGDGDMAHSNKQMKHSRCLEQ